MSSGESSSRPQRKPERRVAPGARLRKTVVGLLVSSSEMLLAVAIVVVFFLLFTGVLVASFPKGTGLRRLYSEILHSDSTASDIVLGQQPRLFFAELVGLRRTVKDRPQHSVAWRTSRSGLPLSDGHAIQTFSASGANISFENRTQLDLAENSLVVLRQTKVPDNVLQHRASLVVLGGEVSGRVPQGGPDQVPLDIFGAEATTRLAAGAEEPAEFSIRVHADESATLRIFSGTAEVNLGDQTSTVSANQALTYHPAKPLGQPVEIPPAPDLVAPASDHRQVYAGAVPPIELRWSASVRADAYRVEVARDEGFSDRLYDRRVSDPALSVGDLGPGRYYWRVSGADGIVESPPSAHRSFEMVQDIEPPPLTVELRQDVTESGQVVVRGVTEPGAKILIGHEEVHIGASGEFEHVLKLIPGLKLIVVESVDAAGNPAYFSQYVNIKGL